MKLKLIALAAAALVSGAANAALYTGAANTNEMFLNVWNATGSYSKDLGITFGTFASLASANTAFANPLSVALNDAAFTAYIGTGSAFSWDITGANAVNNFSTVTTLNGAAPAVHPAKSLVVPEVGGVNNFASALDSAIFAGTQAGIQTVAADKSALYTVGTTSATYAGTGSVSDTAYAAYVNFGTEANNSFSSGLGFIKEVSANTGSNSAAATQTVFNPIVAFMSNTNGAYALNIQNVAAVPEPESLAMLLAGLGMIGSIVARRSRKA